MNYWLIKSEADCYSIDDLKNDTKNNTPKNKGVPWSGIRNYQARNFMRDSMKEGDLCLFYHSGGNPNEPTGVYGIAKVSSKSYPDPTAFDKKDEHYDPKSNKESPTWILVNMAFVEKFKHPVTLSEIKIDPKLAGIMVAQRGSRLSIQPVSETHFEYIRNNLAKG